MSGLIFFVSEPSGLFPLWGFEPQTWRKRKLDREGEERPHPTPVLGQSKQLSALILGDRQLLYSNRLSLRQAAVRAQASRISGACSSTQTKCAERPWGPKEEKGLSLSRCRLSSAPRVLELLRLTLLQKQANESISTSCLLSLPPEDDSRLKEEFGKPRVMHLGTIN